MKIKGSQIKREECEDLFFLSARSSFTMKSYQDVDNVKRIFEWMKLNINNKPDLVRLQFVE